MSRGRPLSEMSDQEIAALALAREQGAWTELVTRHKDRVQWIISRHVMTAEHIEQLTQDTFFKAAMFLKSYRPENSFAAWLRAIAYHTAVDHVRTRPPDSLSLPYRVTLDAADAAGIGVPIGTEFSTPGTPELRAEVELALQSLSHVQRQCVEYHVIERRTYGDIATTLRLPVGTVKSHVSRGLKKLEQLLDRVLESSDPELHPLEDDLEL